MISWPFQEAKKILQKFPNIEEIVFETGYGPSGLPHIGTFGEVFRTAVVANALKKIAPSLKIKIITVSDDMDGLRKIPSNIPNREMLKKYLNRPLTSIPDPFGTHESYGHHMNFLLCKFLDLFEFEYDFKSATECYKSGLFDEKLLLLLKHYDKVMDLILPSLRRERRKTYSSFLPICPDTSQVLEVPIIERNIDKGTITYRNVNGEKMEVPVTKGRCKLQWKPDWGMRWATFKVNYEAHGKDLAPSAVLSCQICEILGEKPPLLFSYEFFLDKEGKKISKSKGNGISIEEWLNYGPVESLALYVFQNPKKAKRLHFDVIPKSTDKYLELIKQYNIEGKDINSPVWHIHRGKVPDVKILGLNFSLLLNLAVACNAETKEILSGFMSAYLVDTKLEESNEVLSRLLDFAVRYYNDFIKPKKIYKAPSKAEKEALLDLKNVLCNLPITANSEEIQSQIFSIGKKHNYGTNLQNWFQMLYKTLLGRDTGPKMGSFIKLYGIDNSISLIEKAIKRMHISRS